MGNLISPPKDTVVLVPPRISTRGLTRPVDFDIPVRVQFGNLFRQEVLHDLHSFDGAVGLDVLVAPEIPPTVAAHFALVGSSDSKTVSDGFLSLFFNREFGDSASAWGRLCIGQKSGLLGNGKFSVRASSSGGYALTVSSPGGHRSPTQVGIRADYKGVHAGIETLVPDYKSLQDSSSLDRLVASSSFWMFSRLSKKVSVGLSGRSLSLSLDGDIPNTDSRYCVSGEFDLSALGSVKVGFSQHLVTHRKVYNPFEDRRVKYIANYIDLALEAVSTSSGTGSVAAGVSWQPNKNILLKLHASSEKGVLATAALRNWWVPSVLACGSVGVSREGLPVVGARLQLSNWLNRAEYERGKPVSELPVTQWMPIKDGERLGEETKLG